MLKINLPESPSPCNVTETPLPGSGEEASSDHVADAAALSTVLGVRALLEGSWAVVSKATGMKIMTAQYFFNFASIQNYLQSSTCNYEASGWSSLNLKVYKP